MSNLCRTNPYIEHIWVHFSWGWVIVEVFSIPFGSICYSSLGSPSYSGRSQIKKAIWTMLARFRSVSLCSLVFVRLLITFYISIKIMLNSVWINWSTILSWVPMNNNRMGKNRHLDIAFQFFSNVFLLFDCICRIPISINAELG